MSDREINRSSQWQCSHYRRTGTIYVRPFTPLGLRVTRRGVLLRATALATIYTLIFCRMAPAVTSTPFAHMISGQRSVRAWYFMVRSRL